MKLREEKINPLYEIEAKNININYIEVKNQQPFAYISVLVFRYMYSYQNLN
jgi:hypothetical protein